MTIKVKWNLSTQNEIWYWVLITQETHMYKPSKNPGGNIFSKDHQRSDMSQTVLTQSVASVLEHFAYKVSSLSDISCIWVWLQQQSRWIQRHLLSYFWVALWFMDALGYSMARVYSEETMVNMHFTDNQIHMF